MLWNLTWYLISLKGKKHGYSLILPECILLALNQRETRNTIAKIENLITFIKREQISNFRKEVEPFNGSLKTVVQIQDYVLHEVILKTIKTSKYPESHLSPDLKWTAILSIIVTKRTEHLGFKMEQRWNIASLFGIQ